MPYKNPGELMFNAEQKEEYLIFEATHNNNANTKSIQQYFRRLRHGEEKFNKDIADMTVDEYVETITMLSIPREGSVAILLSILRNYLDWAQLFNKTENKAPLKAITPNNIQLADILQLRKIKNPAQLTDILTYSAESEAKETQDALAIRLMYLGLTYVELGNLLMTSINSDGLITALFEEGDYKEERFYQADEEIMRLWRIHKEATHIERTGKSRTILCKLVKNSYLFRRVQDVRSEAEDKCDYQFFRRILINVLARYNENTGIELRVTMTSIIESGTFYQLLIQENSGVDITAEVVGKMFYIKDDDQYSYAKNRILLQDYINWKLAFGYMWPNNGQLKIEEV